MKNVRHRSMYSRPAALFLAFAVCLTLIATCLPTTAQAADSGTCGENATWSLDRATGTLTISGIGEMDDYNPSSFGGSAPWDIKEVKRIEIKDGITHIGSWAFAGGEQVTSIAIPDSVSSIAGYAFSGWVFSLFQVPKNITTIYGNAFSNCPNLKAFSVAEGNTAFCATDGVLYDITGATLIKFPQGKATKFTVPSTVKRIGASSFSECRELTSVVISEGVTVIEDHAFQNCRALKEISLPSTLKEIGELAFLYCQQLPSITLPKGLTTIGNNAFNGCANLTTLSIPSGVSDFSVGSGTFSECSRLASIQVAADNQFYCSVDGVLYNKAKTTLLACPPLKSGKLEVPSGVTTINPGACEHCELLREVSLPEGLVIIGDKAFISCWFYDDGLRKVNIPSTVTEIGDYAFAFCTGLTEFTLPEGLTRIGAYAFLNPMIESIAIPDTVISIGEEAFWDTVVLEGRRGGNAETYAQQNGLKFSPLDLPPIMATPNRSTVLVNGEAVAFDAYTINGNNYFKLRDLAMVLSGTNKQFDVFWYGDIQSIDLLLGQGYTAVGGELSPGDGTTKTVAINAASVYSNGTRLYLTSYTINQNNYFKLRDVGQAFDFDVTWDGANNTIVIDTNQSYTAD